MESLFPPVLIVLVCNEDAVKSATESPHFEMIELKKSDGITVPARPRYKRGR